MRKEKHQDLRALLFRLSFVWPLAFNSRPQTFHILLQGLGEMNARDEACHIPGRSLYDSCWDFLRVPHVWDLKFLGRKSSPVWLGADQSAECRRRSSIFAAPELSMQPQGFHTQRSSAEILQKRLVPRQCTWTAPVCVSCCRFYRFGFILPTSCKNRNSWILSIRESWKITNLKLKGIAY